MIKFLRDKSKRAYGLGPLNLVEAYLEKEYGGQAILIREKTLDLAPFTMSQLDKNKKHCSLTALTRLIHYYGLQGWTKIPQDEAEIYQTVRQKGLRLGYLPFIGTIPFRISAIARASFKSYGYRVQAQGIYFWNFYSDVLEEIDANRPLIFNIMRGYYRKHSITVLGYRTYSINGNICQILAIHDGWNRDLRFLDFNQFSQNLLLAGLGSFNKIKIKAEFK